MKWFKFSKLENDYYYGIHRYFWHGLIAIGILTLIVSIFLLIWTFTPTQKMKVEKGPEPQKPAYPEVQEVNTAQIIEHVRYLEEQKRKQEAKKKNIKKKAKEIKKEPEKEEEIMIETPLVKKKVIDSAALRRFNQQIGETKALIDPTENPEFWNDKYIKTFRSERDRKMYKKTKDPSLVVRKLVAKGFKKTFEDYLEKLGYDNYNARAAALEALNTI